MSPEWKPGDVALVELPEGSERPAVLIGVDTGYLCWHSAVSGDFRCLDFDAVAARPLVVIDPEDREQVALLADAFTVAEDPRWVSASSHRLDALQAALREYADPKPPRPDEPTGWLAAVEDRGGNRWAIAGGPTDGDRRWYSPDLNTTRAYADIDAVRVLSEGVTP